MLTDVDDRLQGVDRTPELFIGGEWRAGHGRGRVDVLDPSTEKIIGSAPDADVQDATDAVDAAYRAQSPWAATAPRERAEILRQCFELMQRDAERLACLISLENGKTLDDARGEVAYAAEFFRWFSEEAVRVRGDLGVAPSGRNRILVRYQPIGIAVLVTPWNFPAAMATRKIAPALAAGCTCILKPATATPLTAYAIAALLQEAGVPPGVVNVVSSRQSGAVVGRMLRDPRVRKLSFTGSTEVGRVLLREAADQVIHSSMELGGNAPFVVFEDADIPLAVAGAMVAKMRNGGEACTAANRFLVHEDVAPQFVQGLAQAMQSLRVGPALDPDTGMGPLVDAATLDKVDELVEDAKRRGAVVHCGGQRLGGPGFYYPPTVLSDVPLDAAMFSQEIFGPVAPIYTFKTEEQAVRWANDTEYGLVAYVYTRDLERGLRVSEQIDSGMVALNRGLVSDPAAPFGGMKQSGLGREGAQHGILEFLEAKYIATDW